MNNFIGIKGLAAFMVLLWAVLLTTYAHEKNLRQTVSKNLPEIIVMDGSSCSSSSSGGTE